jgi:flagella basal body P-ring formation protein FlgA
MHSIRFSATLLCGLLWLHNAAAAPTQSHSSIREAARAYLADLHPGDGAELEIEVGRLDRRLQLNRCDRPIEAFASPSKRNTGRVSVGVRCDGAKPWSLYLTAQVRLFGKVAVAAREIPRGQSIRPADLRLQRMDLTKLRRGYFPDIGELLGKRAKRRLPPGRALAPNLVEMPPAVTRGSRVSIVAQVGGIEARMPGTALAHGREGERIRVENLTTERELEARVVSAGVVRVDI